MGHTLRHGGLLRNILEGEVGKKRRRGRARPKYFDQIIGIWDARHLERSNSWHGTEPSGDGWLR